MSVGLLLAFGASIFSGSGSVIQARAVQRAQDEQQSQARAVQRAQETEHEGQTQALEADDPVDPTTHQVSAGSLSKVGRQPLYWIGLLVDLVGFGCAASALQRLPLFMVQAALASSVGVTAMITVLMGARLRPRSWVALACSAVGLILLAISADPSPPAVSGGAWRWWLVVAALGAGGVGVIGMRMRGPLAGPVTAVGAGLGFGTVSISARTLHVSPGAGVLLDPGVWAIIVGGVVGAVFFAAALHRSVVTVISAVTFTVQVVVPSIIGLVLLGDDVRPGFAAAAVIGFLLAAGGAIVLAGRADQPREGLHEPHFPTAPGAASATGGAPSEDHPHHRTATISPRS